MIQTLKKTLKISIVFFLFFLHNILFSQTDIQGKVLDLNTNAPLPYVNIGFIEKEIGTVSNEDGTFKFSFDSSKLSSNDTLKISCLAYRDYKLPFSKLLLLGSDSLVIKMKSDVIRLSEVVVVGNKKRARRKKEKIVGYSEVGKLKNGSWQGKEALGGELVTKINVNKKKRQLNMFFFHVLENASDSLLIRVNVYDGTTKVPEKKLTNQNIIYTLKTKMGKVGIDLIPYDIVIKDNFYIGIELLKVYGDEIGLIIAGNDDYGISYKRYISQGEWKRYSGDALSYFVSTTLMD